jgi:hypothetical protein
MLHPGGMGADGLPSEPAPGRGAHSSAQRDAPVPQHARSGGRAPPAAARARRGPRAVGVSGLTVLLKREGWRVNAKRIYRLYGDEGLTVRTKPRKKLSSRARVPLPAPTRPNERWSTGDRRTPTDRQHFRSGRRAGLATRRTAARFVDIHSGSVPELMLLISNLYRRELMIFGITLNESEILPSAMLGA